MKSPEQQEAQNTDPAYVKEWAERSTQMMMNIQAGGDRRTKQERRHKLGLTLHFIRRAQNHSLEEVAQAVGCTPTLLSFLESGWGTNEEFLSVIDKWAATLRLNSALCHQILGTTDPDTGKRQ